jgi:5'-deoxynucleotidase YfbR-like HD superfamily hydrolase
MLTLLDLFARRNSLILNDKDYRDLQQHILYHDTHERFTGDVPNGLRHLDKVSSSAGHFRELQEAVDNKLGYIQGDLSPHQYNWFKSLDRLEFLLTCYDQRALGNKNIEPCIAYEEKWFATSEIVPSEVRKFVADFEWRRTSNEL